jgi:hypothetical protein
MAVHKFQSVDIKILYKVSFYALEIVAIKGGGISDESRFFAKWFCEGCLLGEIVGKGVKLW